MVDRIEDPVTVHSSHTFSDEDPSLIDIDVVAQALQVDVKTGLDNSEVQRRLEQYGRNELAAAPPVPAWKKFLEQFQDPLVYLLIAATAISLVAWFVERHTKGGGEGLPFDAIVIILILIVNAVLGYMQEAKAQKAVEALASMVSPRANVLREGRVQQVDTTQIVPGDIVVLAEGDSVCADARILHAASLRVAEASLTGESVPVGKNATTLESAKALADRSNMLFNGTAVTQGTGKAIVTSTGMKTQVGKIADLLSATQDEATPLQREMAKVSKMLGIAVGIIAIIVLASLALLEGFHDIQDVIDSLLLSVSLAVAAVPEGLTAVLTVVLALGVQRMAKHHAIVKKLSSVETLGSASVVCSDKTGTLTRNEMIVERVVTPSGSVQITGTGYVPQGRMVALNAGETQGDSQEPSANVSRETLTTLAIGTLANDANIVQDNQTHEWEAVGDPTEAALVVAAKKVKAQHRFESFERIAEIPFTSERKRMSIIAQDRSEAGMLAVFSKGAPDVLLDYCSHIAIDHEVRELTDEDRQQILETVQALSSDAYRTLGHAWKPLGVQSLNAIEGVHTDNSGQVGDIADQAEVIERDLIWSGMVGIIDPPRTEVKASVQMAHRAGVRTVMITGDHPLTAARIAKDLSIIEGDSQPITGEELNALSETQLDETVSHTSVYARVAPEHKLKIVQSLQRQGHIVAMTGDGVNDAPAVKAADIGVAMGITGTEVTRQSAKMILSDDNFATIVAAVREGRGIFDNIRKFMRYLLSSNVGEVFTVFLGVLLGGFLGIRDPHAVGVTVPLLATQLLWINLLTDAAPALAMGLDPCSDDLMDRTPRKMTDRVIDRAMWVDIAFIGLVMAAVTLIGMDLYLPGGLFTDLTASGLSHSEQMVEARTMGFTILVFAQMFNALASRSHDRSVFDGLFSNMWLWAAIGISIVLQLVVIYVPVLNSAFGTMPLSARAWFECIGLSLIVLIASELRKVWVRWRKA